jgi:outer membrane protein
MKRIILFFPVFVVLVSASAQTSDTTGSKTLESCIRYALDHQTNIRQAMIDEQITEREIRIRLSDWYPQIIFRETISKIFNDPLQFLTMSFRR